MHETTGTMPPPPATEWTPPNWPDSTTPPPAGEPAAWGAPIPPPPAPVKKSRRKVYVIGGIGFAIGWAALIGAAGEKDDTSSTSGGNISTATTPTSAVTRSTSASSSSSMSMATWATRYGSDDAEALGGDFETLQRTAGRMDVSGMRSGCRTLQSHVSTAESHLPTPDAAVTSALRDAYRYYALAASYCISGATNYDVDDLGQVSTYLELGGTAIHRATAAMGK